MLETRMSDVVRGLYKDKVSCPGPEWRRVAADAPRPHLSVRFQTEQANKAAAVSPSSGPEDPAAASSSAPAVAKPATQPAAPA